MGAVAAGWDHTEQLRQEHEAAGKAETFAQGELTEARALQAQVLKASAGRRPTSDTPTP
jgi:hypothetical protein